MILRSRNLIYHRRLNDADPLSISANPRLQIRPGETFDPAKVGMDPAEVETLLARGVVEQVNSEPPGPLAA